MLPDNIYWPWEDDNKHCMIGIQAMVPSLEEICYAGFGWIREPPDSTSEFF